MPPVVRTATLLVISDSHHLEVVSKKIQQKSVKIHVHCIFIGDSCILCPVQFGRVLFEIFTFEIFDFLYLYPLCNSYITGTRDVWDLVHQSMRARSGPRAECNKCHASLVPVI